MQRAVLSRSRQGMEGGQYEIEKQQETNVSVWMCIGTITLLFGQGLTQVTLLSSYLF